MIFQKQNCPGDSQKKAFPAFQGPFSQISIKVSFLSMIIPIIVCNFEHIWYLSLSSQNIFHVCTYFAQNIHMSNQTPWTMYNNQIWAPKNLTEPKNQRFGLFLFLLTRPRGVRPRGPPIHIQGHSSPDRWAAILCSLDVQIGDSLYEQITTFHQRDWAVISFLFVCQQIGIQSQITLQKSRLGKNIIFS